MEDLILYNFRGSFLDFVDDVLFAFCGIVLKSIRSGKKANSEVWEGAGELGLEWTLDSPPEYHTFTVQPQVK